MRDLTKIRAVLLTHALKPIRQDQHEPIGLLFDAARFLEPAPQAVKRLLAICHWSYRETEVTR
jgi:hypothetical protein